MSTHDRPNEPRNENPAQAPRSGAGQPNQLSDVRSALRKTADVFGGEDPEGTAPSPADDLFGDASAPPLGQPSGGDRLSYAAQSAQRARASEERQTHLKWALGSTALALVASLILFFWYPSDLLGAGGTLDEDTQRKTVFLLQGDSLMAAGDYESALARYTAAQTYHPDDPYVQQRIDQVTRLRTANDQMAADPEEHYRRQVAQGDSLFSLLGTLGQAEPLLEAQIQAAVREAYLRALVYRPQDREVRDKLKALAQREAQSAEETQETAASALEAEQMRLQQQQLESYRQAIREGDRFLADGDYLEAQIRFKEALIYQRDDTYAAQRLEIIDALWKEANQTERLEGYLARGDELLQAGFFSQARRAYREALAIQPEHEEALARLETCTRLEEEAQQQLEEEHRRELQYRETLAEGDALAASGQYQEAFDLFLSALQTHPDDAELEARIQRVQQEVSREMQVSEEGIYQYLAEGEEPKLIGSLKDLYANIRYPDSAVREGLEGKVFVSFVVDEKGRVRDPQILRGLSADCDREVLRVIHLARFEPGRVDGQPVKVRQTLPITFQLSGREQ